MDKGQPSRQGKDKPKLLTPEQLTQLTQNCANLFRYLTESETGHDEAQRINEHFDVLRAIGSGFFDKGSGSLLLLRHICGLRVDYGKTLTDSFKESGAEVFGGANTESAHVADFPVHKSGVWECALDVVGFTTLKRCVEFGLLPADAHQAYAFAAACAASDFVGCRIMACEMTCTVFGQYLALYNVRVRAGGRAASRWSVQREPWNAPLGIALPAHTFLLVVRNEKRIE